MSAWSQVFVIAATNRPDIIDPAMLRPGRLDKTLYVALPTAPERAQILGRLARSTPLSNDVDLESVAADQRCQGFSGADMAALLREAKLMAVREQLAASQHDDAVQAPFNVGIIGRL